MKERLVARSFINIPEYVYICTQNAKVTSTVTGFRLVGHIPSSIVFSRRREAEFALLDFIIYRAVPSSKPFVSDVWFN